MKKNLMQGALAAFALGCSSPALQADVVQADVQFYAAGCAAHGCGGKVADNAEEGAVLYEKEVVKSKNGTLTEAEFILGLTPENRALYQSLNPESRALARQLNSQKGFEDANSAVKEAHRRSANKK